MNNQLTTTSRVRNATTHVVRNPREPQHTTPHSAAAKAPALIRAIKLQVKPAATPH